MLLKSANNAYKLYCRTRAKPSGASVHRAKEEEEYFKPEIHPLVEEILGKDEMDRDRILQSLKTFRPPQTIFEIDLNKKMTTGAVMEWKRRDHQSFIQQKQTEKETKLQKNLEDEQETINYQQNASPELELEKQEPKKEAERKKRKSASGDAGSIQKKRKTEFKDEKYFMENLPSNYESEKG